MSNKCEYVECVKLFHQCIEIKWLFVTNEIDGNLIAVEPKLERVTDEKGCHDHSHRQSYRHLSPLKLTRDCYNQTEDWSPYLSSVQGCQGAASVLDDLQDVHVEEGQGGKREKV